MSSKTNQQSGGFSEAWLSLREPADHAARDQSIGAELAQWAAAQQTINVMDLGAGTGSNLRFLAPLLGHDQHWTLIDIDEHLLAELPRLLSDWAKRRHVDIVKETHSVQLLAEDFTATIACRTENLATGLRHLSFKNTQLVTASALLDLTSSSWLDELADQCVTNHCAMMFALNYNGLVNWQPTCEHDALITRILNEHQLRDKGFGAACGPGAADYFVNRLELADRSVKTCESNWILNKEHTMLQSALVEGWVTAAHEQDANAQARIQAWHEYRSEKIAQGTSELRVGHVDVLSLR